MAARTVEVHGEVAAGFEPVRAAFEENWTLVPEEIGASVAVMVEGELVVDLWGGHLEPGGRPWERDTLVNVWSSTKGATALAAHMLAERGLLEFDAPVARYWPEFAQAGKGSMPVRYLLTHQAGLQAMPPDLPPEAMYDWDAMTSALAAHAPAFEPGSRAEYHAITFGWLVGEVIRRIGGRTPGTFIREEIAGPLGIDLHVGLPPSEDPRVASILPDRRQPQQQPANAPPPPAPSLQPTSVGGVGALDWNSREWRAAEIPAANGHANARSLATMYGALALGGELRGVRLLEPASVDRAAALQVDGVEASGTHMYRTLGFMRRFSQNDDARPEGIFGHAGAGGSQGFADPERRLGFGYAMNQMLNPQPGETRPATGGLDPRGQHIIRALYGCL